MKEKTGKVVAKLPVDVTSFLLNEKRSTISEIEARHKVQLIVVPDPNLETPHFSVERIRDDDKEISDKSSYELIPEEESIVNIPAQSAIVVEQPVVKSIQTDTPAPSPQKQTSTSTKSGIFSRFFSWLTSNNDQEKSKELPKPSQQRKRYSQKHRDNNRNRSRSSGQRRRGPRDNTRGNNRRRTDNTRNRSNNRSTNNKQNDTNHRQHSNPNSDSSQAPSVSEQSNDSSTTEGNT